jgi:alkylhydroperoxidase family enzyme
MRAGVLDRGPVEIRDREIVIHRTTARCSSEYEWGVHVNAFARPLGLSEEIIRATVTASWNDPIWSASQSALVRLCDELHESSSVSDELWNELEKHFSHEQILELIYTAGVYHTVSFLTNGLRIELEEFGQRFPRPESTPAPGAE